MPSQDDETNPVTELFFVRMTPTDADEAKDVAAAFLGPFPREVADAICATPSANAGITCETVSSEAAYTFMQELQEANPAGGVIRVPVGQYGGPVGHG